MSASPPLQATAIAHPNIALVKYWGKRTGLGNLPAVGSLSITLDTLFTRTHVRFGADLGEDVLRLNDAPPTPRERAKVVAFLDRVRSLAKQPLHAEVYSHNNFPTGAGLASSASGFAALALAVTQALGLNLPDRQLSILARDGSGSAARSIFGGFAEMHRGEREDGSDCYAVPLLPAEAWPLSVVVAITSTAIKSIGSTEGMERTRITAPYYQAWVDSAVHDLDAARGAVARRDFAGLAEVAEHSCLKMHAVAMAARSPLIYWNPTTLAGLQEVRRLRDAGLPVFFTIDAGPQLKAVCLPEAVAPVRDALQALPGVQSVLTCGLGPGAYVLEEGRA